MGGGIKRLILSLLGGQQRDKKKKRMQRQQTVELRVGMDCERCEREVRRALAGIRGVQHVEVSRRQQKVTVTGSMDPHKVLRRAQSTGKKAEMWSQNPSYSSSAAAVHTGQLGPAHLAHERWAPTPLPRPVDQAMGAEHITNMFSDDNPNACSLM